MGLKFELMLVGLILIVSVYTMSIKLRDHNERYRDNGKELEFYDTTFTEVNQSRPVDESYGIKGERIRGVLFVEKFWYKDDQIALLRADRAKDNGKVIELTGAVRLKRFDGFRFETERAVYRKSTDVLQSDTPFVAYKSQHRLRGDWMRYEGKRAFLEARHVHATIVLNGHETIATKEPK